jgi:hypothetical protein
VAEEALSTWWIFFEMKMAYSTNISTDISDFWKWSCPPHPQRTPSSPVGGPCWVGIGEGRSPTENIFVWAFGESESECPDFSNRNSWPFERIVLCLCKRILAPPVTFQKAPAARGVPVCYLLDVEFIKNKKFVVE